MASRTSFAFGEWYHCYNRGVDKRAIFENEHDANRFLMLLYLSNGTKPVGLYNFRRPEISKAFTQERGKPLAAIGAFCLMPNHYHLLVKETHEGGITALMRKIGTAYTMYFNAKYKRVGHLFSGQFRSRHVTDDRYFQKAIEYIHCNPAELYEPGWKSGKVRNMRLLERKLLDYPYSSLRHHTNRQEQNPILSGEVFNVANPRGFTRTLGEANEYYSQIEHEAFER